MVCAYAIEQTGNPDVARELLADWHLRRSEQIGALVYALIAYGIFQAEPDDSPEEFDGLPPLREIIEQAVRASSSG